MKKNNRRTYFLLLLFFVEILNAQRIYVLDEKYQIGFLDVKDDCKFHLLCTITDIGGVTDISFHPNGKLYLLENTGKLFTLDTLDCSHQLVGNLPNGMNGRYNALTADADGVVYAAGDFMAKFDPKTGEFSDLGALPDPWGWSSGDLTFRDGTLFLVTQSNAILKVNLGNPKKSTVLFTLGVPTNSAVYGIVTAANGCNSQVTYATVSEPGNQHFLYEVDFKNKEISKKCTTPNGILGATTTKEFLVSECDSTVVDPPSAATFAVYLPNIFSPDDNGKNDFFTPFVDIASEPTVELLRIYDRWGGLVFEKKDFQPNNEPEGWNGSWANSGKKVMDGVYVYYCQIGFGNGARVTKIGSVTVAKSVD